MKQQKGFTIIEVLIVLAVAGLILVVIFFAIPQMRLTIRNEQRKREAASYVQSVRECLANKGTVKTACDSQGEVPIDKSAIGVYENVYFCGSGGTAASTGCGATVDGFPDFSFMYANGYDYSSSATWPFLEIRYGHKCSSYPNRSEPAGKDSIAAMVPYEKPDGTSYSKCFNF